VGGVRFKYGRTTSHTTQYAVETGVDPGDLGRFPRDVVKVLAVSAKRRSPTAGLSKRGPHNLSNAEVGGSPATKQQASFGQRYRVPVIFST